MAARLHCSLWRGAFSGEGSFNNVIGEAGIGKTMLLDLLLDRASELDAVMGVSARCTLSLQPHVDIIGGSTPHGSLHGSPSCTPKNGGSPSDPSSRRADAATGAVTAAGSSERSLGGEVPGRAMSTLGAEGMAEAAKDEAAALLSERTSLTSGSFKCWCSLLMHLLEPFVNVASLIACGTEVVKVSQATSFNPHSTRMLLQVKVSQATSLTGH